MAVQPIKMFPDVKMDDAAQRIQTILKENDLGGAVIIVSPRFGGMMLIEPEGWYRKDVPDTTIEEKQKFGHYLTCMHQISSTMHTLYHQELERLGAFSDLPGTNADTVWH